MLSFFFFLNSFASWIFCWLRTLRTECPTESTSPSVCHPLYLNISPNNLWLYLSKLLSFHFFFFSIFPSFIKTAFSDWSFFGIWTNSPLENQSLRQYLMMVPHYICRRARNWASNWPIKPRNYMKHIFTEKLIVAQLLKSFLVFHVNKKFITAFKRARYWLPPWTIRTKFTAFSTILLLYILLLLSMLTSS
jgi:hypothetical protein